MTVPSSIVIAIASAVERRGGDMDDVADLVSLWMHFHGEREQPCARADQRHEAHGRPVCERRNLAGNRPRKPTRRRTRERPA